MTRNSAGTKHDTLLLKPTRLYTTAWSPCIDFTSHIGQARPHALTILNYATRVQTGFYLPFMAQPFVVELSFVAVLIPHQASQIHINREQIRHCFEPRYIHTLYFSREVYFSVPAKEKKASMLLWNKDVGNRSEVLLCFYE